MSNVAEPGEEHSIIWGMFMAATMNAATFMGKNFSTIQNFIMNSEDLTLKQMFYVTAQLVKDQEGLDKIHWGKNSWKRLSLVGDETVITSSQILCCALERSINIRNPTKLGRTELQGSNQRKATEIMMVSMESTTEFEWNIFPGFTTLQLCDKINDLLSDLGETPENFTRIILFMSMTSPVTEKTTKMNVWQMPESSKYLRKDSVLDNGYFLVQVPRRSGILQRMVHKELGIISRTKMLLKFAESGHPTFRATTPLSRCILKSKRHGKLSIHFSADNPTIETIFSHQNFRYSAQYLRNSAGFLSRI